MPEAARAFPDSISALPSGTRLGEFEIRSLLGVGGFGIVYLAFDHALEREVAIKEYMPASMAGRTETLHVSLRSKSDADVFALGLKSFVNEARLLARFDHPSLIKVHRFWEANGTAYMAMPVLRGQTLKEFRRLQGRCPEEGWIRATLAPLLGALEQLHQAGVFHRDISPDNIHIELDGRPVLLDFGAARHVIGGKTQALTAILKPAYAPIEQFGETEVVRQGPWTDLYALGATLHYLLLGYPPAPATARMVSNEGSGLSPASVPACSNELLAMVEWMLAPRPNDRPQSVAELRAVLERRARVPAHALATTPPDAAARRSAAQATPHVVTVPLEDVRHADLELDGGMSTSAAASTARRPLGRPGAASPHAGASTADALAIAADDAHRLPPPPARSRALPLVLLVLALIGAAGYFVWRVRAPAESVPAAATAASAVSPAVLSGAAAAANTAPSPIAGDGAVGSPSAAAASPSAAASSAAGAQVVAPVSTPSPTAATRPDDAAPAGAAPAAGRSSGAPGPGVPTADLPRETAVPAGPTAPASSAAAKPTARPPAAAAPPPAASPSAICRGRNELSHYICMERECARPAFSQLPECRAARLQAPARDAGRP